MCLPAAIAPILGTVVSAVSSVAGIAQAQNAAQMQARQAQQQAEMQVRQQQEQMNLQYQQQVEQGRQQNRASKLRYDGQVRSNQAAQLAYQNNLANANQAANSSYVQEQVKLKEKRDAAAFKAQANYAKAIGAQGSVLASGATGQSVGLLQLDAERQMGFATAQENASLRSAEQQSAVSQDIAFTQAKTSFNQAYSSLPAPAQAPEYDKYGLTLGIPTSSIT